MSQGAVYTKTDVYVCRFGLILFSLILVVVAIIECAVASSLEFSKTLVRPAMWIGVVFWVFLSITAWEFVFTKNKNLGLLFVVALFFTAMTMVSAAGLYMMSLRTLTLWINMALSIFFLISAVFVLPKAWKDLRV